MKFLLWSATLPIAESGVPAAQVQELSRGGYDISRRPQA